MPAGNSVPVVTTVSTDCHMVWLTFANSFVGDYLIRQKISTHLNLFYVESWPLLRPLQSSEAFSELRDRSGRLCSTTPDIELSRPALDPRERARLRSEIDALVSQLYKLSPAEFAYVLTTFPLLDRDQPPLPGDAFARWDKGGKAKEEPRSYVTRDTALLAYFQRLNEEPPRDLLSWYREEVGINMIDDPACPFRMGPIRSLEARVAEYHRRGAIAYIPSKAKKWDPNGSYQPPDLPRDWKAWIVIDPDIRGGTMTLKGTRLSVDEVKKQLFSKTFEEIRNSFPQLTEAHIAVAMATSLSGA
jgi:uncharacterized protein (DUF433 family)